MDYTSTNWIVAIIICLFIIALFFILGNYFRKNSNEFIVDTQNSTRHPEKYRLYFLMFTTFVVTTEVLLEVFAVRPQSQLIPNLIIGAISLVLIYFSYEKPFFRRHLSKILITFYCIFTLTATYKVRLDATNLIYFAEFISMTIFAYYVFHKVSHFFIYLAILFVLLLSIHLQGKMDIKTLVIYDSLLLMAGALNYARDIIDGKMKERLLQAYNIVNQGNIWVIGINNMGIITFISDNICLLLNDKKEEVIGKKWTKDFPYFSEIIIEVASNTADNRFIQKITYPSGEYKWIEWQNLEYSSDLTFKIGRDITEQKEKEQKIEQLSLLHQNLLDNVSGYVACKDYDGRFLFVNKSVAALFGKKPEEVIGLKDADFGANEAEIAFYQATDRQVIDTNAPLFIAEETILRKDKTRGIFQTNKTPVIIDGKKAVLVVATEISELKKVEEALRKSEELIRYKSQILSAIAKTTEKLLVNKDVKKILAESFALIGEATNVDRVYYFERNIENNTVNQIVEWARGSVSVEIDNPLLQNIVPEDLPELYAKLLENTPYSIHVHEVKNMDLKNLLESQGILSMLNIPIFVKDTFYGFIGFDDCTENRVWSIDEVSILQSLASNIANAIEQRNNEAMLAESEHNFRQINETIERVFWLYDVVNSKYLYINPVCETVLGVKQADFYEGKPYTDVFILPEYREKNKQTVVQLMEHDSYELTYQIMRIEGQTRWIQEKTFAIRDKQGKLIRVSGICADITEKMEKEKELERLLSVTKQQNERLTNFAHIISHNVRSHSSNLISLMEFIQQASTVAEKEMYLDLVQKSVDKLAETIENLNEIITIQNNLNIPKTSLYLKREISTTINALTSIINAAQAHISYNIADNLTVQAIPAYLESILLNLLTNAIKYRSLERPLVITFYTYQKDNYLVLAIQDNGIGIDLVKHGHKLFGMYKTFHKNKDARGIGLFITKSQIESMNGKIEVESQVGIGTTFHIYFYEKN